MSEHPLCLDPELLERQQALRLENANLRRQLALRANYGINYYRPHAKQHKFHVSLATGRYARTGNRFGKSEMGIAEDIAWLMGYRAWYRETFDIFDGQGQVVDHHVGSVEHPFTTSGIPNFGVKGLLLVVDWDMAKKIFTNRTDDPKTCGKLFKFLPKECYDHKGAIHLSRGGHIDQIEVCRPTSMGGGVSTLTIDTIEAWKHNRLGGESADWDFIHVDEPCPEPMFKSFARGLMDRNGKYWFTCTPLDEMWINDNFTPPKGGTAGPDGVYFIKDGAKRFIIEGSIYDNPHRSPEGVAEFESTLTREEKECRLYGMPLAMAGRVYKEFIYDLHVLCDVPLGWADYHLPPLDYTVRCAWDVHDKLPQAILKVATDPTGIAFVYDEMFDESLIQPNATRLKNSLWSRNVQDMLMDPYAWNPDPRDGSCIADDIDAVGLFFEKASKDLTRGVSKVREKLLERNRNGLPTICFSPRLTQTLFEFSHYCYDTEKNEPKDKDNHMMENLYRLVLNGLEYVKPKGSFVPPVRRVVSHDEDLLSVSLD